MTDIQHFEWLSPTEYGIVKDRVDGCTARILWNTFCVLLKQKYNLPDVYEFTVEKGAHGH